MKRAAIVCVLILTGCARSKPPVISAPAPVTVPAPVTPQPAVPTPEAPAVEQPVPRPTPARPPVAQSPTPAPAPKLGTLLTADQRRQLESAYQSDLKLANAVLAGVGNRTLTADQSGSVSRIRAFLAQAAASHDRDLAASAELARRARVLAQSLAAK